MCAYVNTLHRLAFLKAYACEGGWLKRSRGVDKNSHGGKVLAAKAKNKACLRNHAHRYSARENKINVTKIYEGGDPLISARRREPAKASTVSLYVCLVLFVCVFVHLLFFLCLLLFVSLLLFVCLFLFSCLFCWFVACRVYFLLYVAVVCP